MTQGTHLASGKIEPEACMCFNYVCIIIDNASFAFLLKCFILFYICVCVCVCIYMRIYIYVYVYVYIYVVCCLCGPSCVLNKVIIIIITSAG